MSDLESNVWKMKMTNRWVFGDEEMWKDDNRSRLLT
jgi:hypothetical protein